MAAGNSDGRSCLSWWGTRGESRCCWAALSGLPRSLNSQWFRVCRPPGHALQAGSLIAGGSLSAEPPWKSYCVLLSFSCSLVSSYLQPHGLQHSRLPCPSPSHSLLKLTSIESVMPSSHLVFCRSLLLLPSIFPSIRVFSNESALCNRSEKHGRGQKSNLEA